MWRRVQRSRDADVHTGRRAREGVFSVQQKMLMKNWAGIDIVTGKPTAAWIKRQACQPFSVHSISCMCSIHSSSCRRASWIVRAAHCAARGSDGEALLSRRPVVRV